MALVSLASACLTILKIVAAVCLSLPLYVSLVPALASRHGSSDTGYGKEHMYMGNGARPTVQMRKEVKAATTQLRHRKTISKQLVFDILAG